MVQLRILGTSAIVIGILTIAASNLYHFFSREIPKPNRDQLRSVLPEADRFEPQEHFFRGYAPDGTLAGVVFLTSLVPPRINGFTAEIDILVSMNPEGVLSRLEIIDHEETPSYIRMILDAGLLQAFAGMDVQSGFAGIDAVSGATVSSETIIQDIQSAAVTIARRAYDMDVPQPSALRVKSRWYLDCPLVLLLFLAVAFARRYRFRGARAVPLLLGFLVIGIYLNSPLSLNHLTNLASFHPPSLFRHPGLFTLLLITLGVTPVFGNMYCSHLCPFGAVIELGTAIFPSRIQVSHEWIRRGATFRFFLLLVLTVGIFGFGFESLAYLEPYPYLFSGTTPIFLWIYIVLAVSFSVVFRRFWCRICCPTGAVLDLIARRKRRKTLRESAEKSGNTETKE